MSQIKPMQASQPLELSTSTEFAIESANYKVDAIFRAESAAREALKRCAVLESENKRLERAIAHLRSVTDQQAETIENIRKWAASLKQGKEA